MASGEVRISQLPTVANSAILLTDTVPLVQTGLAQTIGQPVQAAVGGILAPLANTTTPGWGTSLIQNIQPYTGAVARTQRAKNSDMLARADFTDDATFNAAKVGKISVDALSRLRAPTFVAGTEELTGPTVRDAFVVGRNVIGDTNCHGFADRTQMSGVTDAGTYGSFDCTVSLTGTNDQNHLYVFQDRVQLAQSGPGQVRDSAGFMSQAQISGGRILRRYGMFIDPIVVSGGAVVEQQIGLLINHQTGATANVGLNLGQTAATGWAIYAAGGGKSHHLGQFGFGTEPDSGTSVHVAGNGRTVALRVDATSGGYGLYDPVSGGKHYLRGVVSLGLDSNPGTVPLTVTNPDDPANKVAFISSDLTRGTFGVLGDARLAFVVNSLAQLVVEDSAGGYAVRPNSDNAQTCGSASFRWSVIYAGTGAINTSDERLKEQFVSADAAEKRVALAIKALIGKFKYRDAVVRKGSAARWHFGVAAQKVAAAFRAEGLDPAAYGMFCYDEWPATEEGPADNRYGIRYDELAMFILAAS